MKVKEITISKRLTSKMGDDYAQVQHAVVVELDEDDDYFEVRQQFADVIDEFVAEQIQRELG